MFHRIVVGLEPGGTGRAPAALAQRLAAPDAELILTSVVSSSGPAEERLALTRKHLEQTRRALAAGAGPQHAVRVEVLRAESPAVGLHRIAAHTGADLIAIGSCARGPLGRLVAGDDTGAVLRAAPCTVAVAPHEGRGGTVHRVGAAWDGGELAGDVLAVARELADGLDAEVAAIRVMPRARLASDPLDVALQDAATAERGGLSRALRSAAGSEARLVEGVPVRELAEFSEEVDLLVVGSHHRGTLERLVLGSTAEHLARHIACPLIAVPLQGDDR